MTPEIRPRVPKGEHSADISDDPMNTPLAPQGAVAARTRGSRRIVVEFCSVSTLNIDDVPQRFAREMAAKVVNEQGHVVITQ